MRTLLALAIVALGVLEPAGASGTAVAATPSPWVSLAATAGTGGAAGAERAGSGTVAAEPKTGGPAVSAAAAASSGQRPPALPAVHHPPPVPTDPSAPLRVAPPARAQTEASGSPRLVAQGQVHATSTADESQDLVFFTNTALNASSAMSSVDEPSVAVNGNTVFYTGNWYAAASTDGGKSFSYISPFTFFSPPSGTAFCCDQRVIYDPSRDLMIWVLLYSSADHSQSAVRIAVAHGQSSLTASGSWVHYKFIPTDTGFSTGTWFDYPQLGLSSNDLYFTATGFSSSTSAYAGTAIARIPLDQLAAGGSISYGFIHGDSTVAMYTPVARSGSTTMYWARHETTTSLKIYRWAESSPTSGFLSAIVSHSAYVSANTNPATCSAPDGSDPCGDIDSRIMAGWVANGVAGFMWMAAPGTGGLGAFPYPYVHVVRIDPVAPSLVDEPIIWNGTFAWVYPGAAANGRGGLAVSATWAGGGRYPNSSVLVLDDLSPSSTWQSMLVRSGAAGPPGNRWGDYVTVAPAASASGVGNTWVATSYTLQGTCAAASTPCANVEPRFLWFGRQRDNPRGATLANDDFVFASDLPIPGTVTGNTVSASTEGGEPLPTCGPVGNTLWYRLAPSTTGSLTITTAGSSFDTVLGLYTGSSLSGLTQGACNDNDPAGGSTSLLNATVIGGQTYYLQLGGRLGASGSFTLQLFFTNATILLLSAGGIEVNNPVTVAAVVGSTGGTPTGAVVFSDSGAALSDCGGASGVALASGVASCTTSPSTVGTHTITAAYAGSGSFAQSTSAAAMLTVVAPCSAPPAPPRAGPAEAAEAAERRHRRCPRSLRVQQERCASPSSPHRPHRPPSLGRR